MISWEEFIKSNILEFRNKFKKLSEESKKLVKENKEIFRRSFNKPCQVLVFNFNKDYPTCFAILHDAKHPDMLTIVFEKIAFRDLHAKATQDQRLLRLLGKKGVEKLVNEIGSMAQFSIKGVVSWISAGRQFDFANGYLLFERRMISLSATNYGLARTLFSFMEPQLNAILREKQRERIEETVDDLKRDAKSIPEGVELRAKIIENTRRLDSQMKQLDKKVKKEIGAIRKLVGTSKDFLDWKAFSTDVEHLKETHIAKDVFDVHIKRLDEKIDKGLEALNTRIEDLKAIKFWSKRTLLEIALAIWGAIVTLYATGILKL